MQPHERTFVALDVDDLDKVGNLIEEVSPHVGGWKIGMQLCTSVGAPQAAKFIQERGGKVFKDLKFKDIPNTVAGAAAAAARLGVMMFNVHADGGSKMMKAARSKLDEHFLKHGKRPYMLGVTVLTSMDVEAMQEIGYHHEMTVDEQVRRLATLAFTSGCDGVVASAREARLIRQAVCDEGFLIVTPAIQPKWATWAAGMDQDKKRITTHIEAIQAGADYLVIGRAILKAPNPVDAAKRIADELAGVAA